MTKPRVSSIIWSVILLLSILSWTSYSAAQTPTINRTRLAKGKPAPFAGVLLSDGALAKIISDNERKLKLLNLDLEKLKRQADSEAKTSKAVCDAKLEAASAKHGACLRDLDRRDKLLDKALQKCPQDLPWYKAPQLHFILGNIVAGGICAAATRIQ